MDTNQLKISEIKLDMDSTDNVNSVRIWIQGVESNNYVYTNLLCIYRNMQYGLCNNGGVGYEYLQDGNTSARRL